MLNHINLPDPPAFLDPLFNIDNCYYYTVPKFFPASHPTTRWLIKMIRNGEIDRVKRKIDMSPEAFSDRLYQLLDLPTLYVSNDPSMLPMFKRKTVLYLSVLGMALYLRSTIMVEMLSNLKDITGSNVINPMEAQYATHVQDLAYGDFHSFAPFVIMLRMECFDCAVPLMQAGWKPSAPISMPMRRKFERRVFHFHDWLEVALGILSIRSLYPLQQLIMQMTKDLVLYERLELPITKLVTSKSENRVPCGLIDVDELPATSKMIGVSSLLELTIKYDKFLQMRSCATEIEKLKKEAISSGMNPEILMMQIDDYDPVDAEDTEQDGGNNSEKIKQNSNLNNFYNNNFNNPRCWNAPALNANVNNSATEQLVASPSQELIRNLNNIRRQMVKLNTNTNAAKTRKKGSYEEQYASEACRILHFALERDKFGKSLHLCLDSVSVLIKRDFFTNLNPQESSSRRGRDLRNTVVLLLNLVQREQVKVDQIVAKIKSGHKKFQHLEEHKLMENRKQAGLSNIKKMISILMRILLYSKMLVKFVSSKFPPFEQKDIDFTLNPAIQKKFEEIKDEVESVFNSMKDAWMQLTPEQMIQVNKRPTMEMHFRVGNLPTEKEIEGAMRDRRRQNKNKSNMTNTNSCFVTFKKVQRKRRPTQWKELSGIDEARSQHDRRSVVRNIELTMSSCESMRQAMGEHYSSECEEEEDDSLLPAKLALSNLCKEVDALFNIQSPTNEENRNSSIMATGSDHGDMNVVKNGCSADIIHKSLENKERANHYSQEEQDLDVEDHDDQSERIMREVYYTGPDESCGSAPQSYLELSVADKSSRSNPKHITGSGEKRLKKGSNRKLGLWGKMRRKLVSSSCESDVEDLGIKLSETARKVRK